MFYLGAVSVEDVGLIPALTLGLTTNYNYNTTITTSFRKLDALIWPLGSQACNGCTDTHARETLINVK